MIFENGFASGSLEIYSSSNVITTNTWQHVVFTWDGTANRTHVNFYVNGVVTGRQDDGDGSYGSGTRAGVADAGCSLIIGDQQTFGSCTSTDRAFDGFMDEVRVYNRVLTAAEVKQLYLMGK